MATNSDSILVGANGTVWAAAVGTAGPTSSSFDPTINYVEVGLVDEAGAKFSDSKEVSALGVWKSFYAARRIVTARESMVGFVLRTWDAVSVPLAFGGGAVTGGGGAYEKDVVVLVGFSGTDSFKLTIDAVETAVITRGTNYTAAGIEAALEAHASITMEVSVKNVTDEGFEVTFLSPVGIGVMTVTSGIGATGTVGTVVAGAAPSGAEYVFTPPDPEEIDEKALVIIWADGAKDYVLDIPKGMVVSAVETTLTRTASADLPIEFAVTPEPGDAPWKLYTNDPSFA